MRIALLLAAAALSYHPQLPQFQPRGEIAVELGCPLSEAGYQKLRKAWAWEGSKERSDYYYDGYNGERYLMKKQDVKLKVRLKLSDAKAPHWQISRFLAKDDVAEAGLVVKVHTTESWEGKVKGKDGQALVAATDAFFAREAAGGAPMRAAAQDVDKAWRKLRASKDLPGLPALDHYLGTRPYQFIPVKRTIGKTRLRANRDGMHLSLGTEPERDTKGRQVLVHELEVEPDKPWTVPEAQAAARKLARLLAAAGIKAADQVDPPGLDGYLYTLGQLRR